MEKHRVPVAFRPHGGAARGAIFTCETTRRSPIQARAVVFDLLEHTRLHEQTVALRKSIADGRHSIAISLDMLWDAAQCQLSGQHCGRAERETSRLRDTTEEPTSRRAQQYGEAGKQPDDHTRLATHWIKA